MQPQSIDQPPGKNIKIPQMILWFWRNLCCFFPWEQKTYSNLKWTCWRIPNIWENPIVLVKIAFVIVYLCNLSGSTWKHMLKLVLFHRSVCVVILSWYVNSYVYIVTIYIHYNCNIIVYIYIYIIGWNCRSVRRIYGQRGKTHKYIYIDI